MKNLRINALVAMLALSAPVALAATGVFTDEGSFADWFAPSVSKMNDAGVIKGYADGSFKPGNNVTRAELAVILDRYSENVVQRQIADYYDAQIVAGTGYNQGTFNWQIQKVIDNIERFDNKDIDYKSAIIMAESGLNGIEKPADFDALEKSEAANVPEGYEVYQKVGIVYQTYLHYVGQRPEGDVLVDVDQWFGPF